MNLSTLDKVLILLVAALLLGVKLPGCPAIGPAQKPTAVTYVWEKDITGAVPAPVLSALNKINRDGRGVVATNYEIDTTDGDDEIPDQYKAPAIAAKEAGLPSLVVTAGPTVLKVVKDPRTEAAVLEAVP